MENDQKFEVRYDKCESVGTEQERRRYALLQAAATVYAGGGGLTNACVTAAENLLEEIERREK